MASQHQTLNDKGINCIQKHISQFYHSLRINKQRQKLANISLTFEVLTAYRMLDNKE